MTQSKNIEVILMELFDRRQDLIICFTNICNIDIYKEKDFLINKLDELYELLIDYSATGQLRTFTSILEKNKRENVGFKSNIKKLINLLLENTLSINELNAEYDKNKKHNLNKDTLSKLGSLIYERASLEDKLIQNAFGRDYLKQIAFNSSSYRTEKKKAL